MSAVPQVGGEAVRRIRREEWARIVAAGLFEGERLELLEGAIVPMSPQNAEHAYSVHRLFERLVAALAGVAMVRCQAPLGLGDVSEPEPDLAVVPVGDYRHTHPALALLVIEVAASSLQKDLELKAALYARAGVPEYWVVNLVDRVVQVHREPKSGGYGQISRRASGDVVTATSVAFSVPVDDVLP